jgi:hypothetical protein
MRKILLLSAPLLLATSACARNIVQTPPARCADLIPSDWEKGVDGEPLPGEQTVPVPLTDKASAVMWEAVAKVWAQAFTGQAGQLGKANDRTKAAIGIFRRCEAMINEAR